MKALKLITVIACFLFSTYGKATTWNEPWFDAVVKNAQYFVLAKVKKNDEEKGVTISIIKTLAGPELKGTIKITKFSLLRLGSVSAGHGTEFQFEEGSEVYFFISQNKEGDYCIATPTTGFALIVDGKVHATYRHSYHQAAIEPDLYENTMVAIFNNYHGLAYDKEYITKHIDKYIALPPTTTDFFNQHVALECIYHLRLSGYYSQILPFLYNKENYHDQLSAARALIVYNTPECKRVLVDYISGEDNDIFAKVLCVWSLAEFKPVELKAELTKIAKTASTEENGFGGNIMDPRVGTYIPTVKEALNDLISTL